MIKCEKTDGGGTIIVSNEGVQTAVSFTVSDSTASPLVLQIKSENSDDIRVLDALTESLASKYTPAVLFLTTENARLRYNPWIGKTLYRHSTKGERSLYTNAFSGGDSFTRMWSLAESMNEYSFVRSNGEELQFFDRYAVLGRLRRQMKPFEFLSIKEECDYSIQRSCVNTTRGIIEAAESTIAHAGKKSEAFSQVIKRLRGLQADGSFSFDTKTAYLQQAIEEIFLPAFVLFGSGNKFTKAITEAFVRGAAEYTTTSEELMSVYEDALQYLLENKVDGKL